MGRSECIQTAEEQWSGENKILSKELQIQAQHYSICSSEGVRDKYATADFRYMKHKSSTEL